MFISDPLCLPTTMPSRRSVLSGIGAAGLAAFGVGAAGAQSDDGDDPTELAAVRVAHASSDAGPVDVEVDGDEVLTDLAFRRVSDYLTLEPGDYDVRVTEAGGDDPEAFFEAEDLSLDPGAYTVVAGGEATVDESTFQVDVLRDAPVDVDDGAARVRAVHASPDAGPVDVTVDDAALTAFDDLTEFDAETTTLDAGEYELEVRPDGDDDDDYDDEDFARVERLLSLAAGESHTVLVLGYATPDGEASTEGLGLVVVENRTSVPTPDEDEEKEDDEEEQEDDDEEEQEDDDEEEQEDDDEEEQEDDDEEEEDDDEEEEDDDEEEEDDDENEGRGPPPGRGEGRGPPEERPPEWAGPE